MAQKANVGDLIQYRYRTDGGFHNHDTRRVTDALGDDHGHPLLYFVEGGFLVLATDVLCVIPAEEPVVDPSEYDTAEFVLDPRQ